MLSERDKPCALLAGVLLLSAATLMPSETLVADTADSTAAGRPRSDSETAALARRVVDALIQTREENTRLTEANQKLTSECKSLEAARAALRQERDALRRLHTEEAGRREGLEVVVAALEQGQRQYRLKVADLESKVVWPPPCPWAAVLTNLTGTALSRLHAGCGGVSHASPAPVGGKGGGA